MEMVQSKMYPRFVQVEFDNRNLCRIRKYKIVVPDDPLYSSTTHALQNCTPLHSSSSSSSPRRSNNEEQDAATGQPTNVNVDDAPLVRLVRGKKKKPRSFRYEQQEKHFAKTQSCASRIATPVATAAEAESDPIRSLTWFREDQVLWLPADEQRNIHLVKLVELQQEKDREQQRVLAMMQAAARNSSLDSFLLATATPQPPPPPRKRRSAAGRDKPSHHVGRFVQKPRRHKTVALLLCGEMRKLHLTARPQKSRWIDANNNINFNGMNNNVDVFAATWPSPLDEPVSRLKLGYAVEQLRKALGDDRLLAAVRVDTYSPQRMFLRSAFGQSLKRQGSSAPMLYLFEAVARLVVVQYRACDYDFYIRSRFDLMPLDTIRLYPLPRTLQRDGYWYVEVGESVEGWRKFRSAASSDPLQKGISDEDRGYRYVVKDGPSTARMNGRLLQLPSNIQFVVHHVTLGCVNDWIAVGRYSSLLETSSVFSLASMKSTTASSVRENNGKNSTDHPVDWIATDPGGQLIYFSPSSAYSKYNQSVCDDEFERLQSRSGAESGNCYAEICIATSLVDSGIDWGVANLRVGLGTSNEILSTPRNVFGPNDATKMKKCKYF